MVSLSWRQGRPFPANLGGVGPLIRRMTSGAAVASEGARPRRDRITVPSTDALLAELDSHLRCPRFAPSGCGWDVGHIPTVSHSSGAPPLVPTAGCFRFNQKPNTNVAMGTTFNRRDLSGRPIGTITVSSEPCCSCQETFVFGSDRPGLS